MQAFTCDTCGREFEDGIDAGHHEIWHTQKAEGERVAALLSPLPVGTEFQLTHVQLAYLGLYRKNSAGLWDQVAAPESPLVRNMSADHLGFCVGEAAVVACARRSGAIA